jgi:programmed cell death protein 4|eukprot:Stramenopile-MAST_4_protein_2707
MASFTSGKAVPNIWAKTAATANKAKVSDKERAISMRLDRIGRKKKPLASFQQNATAKTKAKKHLGSAKMYWGEPGDELNYDYVEALDRNDPNYDSAEDDGTAYFVGSGDLGTHGYGRTSVTESRGSPPRNEYSKGRNALEGTELTLPSYKKKIIPVLEEYFVSLDKDEVERHMYEINAPHFHYEFVKRAITMAMDRKDRGCESASKLLSFLYGAKHITTNQIGKGFERLFEVVDDLSIDVPDAERIISSFVARSVVDEILPPRFLMDEDVKKLGGEIISRARTMLSVKHARARITKGWGPGDGRMTQELKTEIKMLLSEYFTTSDLVETASSVIALDAKWFYHEVVKRAVVFAMSKRGEEQIMVSKLFKYLFDYGAISEDQFIIGFARILDEIDDIQLDTPDAGNIFEGFVSRGMQDSYLPSNFLLMVAASSGSGEQIRRMHQEFRQ